MHKLKDIIRIEEKISIEGDDDYLLGEKDGHNSLLNTEVDVDVEEIEKVLSKNPIITIECSSCKTITSYKDLANAIKTALLSGKIVKEKRK